MRFCCASFWSATGIAVVAGLVGLGKTTRNSLCGGWGMSRTYKPLYRQSRAFDASCRNHGACSWCRLNRQYANLKREAAARYAMWEAGLLKYQVRFEVVEVDADSPQEAVLRAVKVLQSDVRDGQAAPFVHSVMQPRDWPGRIPPANVNA